MPNSEQNPERSVSTKVDSSTTARLIISFRQRQLHMKSSTLSMLGFNPYLSLRLPDNPFQGLSTLSLLLISFIAGFAE